nr:protein kinase [Chromohalobacter sp.]
MAVLHEKAIHRDIKPSNILIKGGAWLVSDFGLCALVDEDPLSMDGEVVEPMNWMSQEESARLSVFASDRTESSDVFQLASLFWLVVTRRHPSGIICRDDWTGPPKLFEPLSRALQHEPMRRLANGSEFAAAIVSAIEP